MVSHLLSTQAVVAEQLSTIPRWGNERKTHYGETGTQEHQLMKESPLVRDGGEPCGDFWDQSGHPSDQKIRAYGVLMLLFQG